MYNFTWNAMSYTITMYWLAYLRFIIGVFQSGSCYDIFNHMLGIWFFAWWFLFSFSLILYCIIWYSTYSCGYMQVDVYLDETVDIRCPFETGTLIRTRCHWLDQSGWPVCFRDLSVSSLAPVLEWQMHSTMPRFYVGAGTWTQVFVPMGRHFTHWLCILNLKTFFSASIIFQSWSSLSISVIQLKHVCWDSSSALEREVRFQLHPLWWECFCRGSGGAHL